MAREFRYEDNILPNLEEIRKMAQAGCTEKQIAEEFKVSLTQFKKWKKDPKKTAFVAALKKGRKGLTIDLIDSLYKRAKGYEYTEKHQEFAPDPNNKDKKIVTKSTITQKAYPPDVGAIIFSLTNLDPENWKNRRDSNIKGKVEVDNLADAINNFMKNAEEADE